MAQPRSTRIMLNPRYHHWLICNRQQLLISLILFAITDGAETSILRPLTALYMFNPLRHQW